MDIKCCAHKSQTATGPINPNADYTCPICSMALKPVTADDLFPIFGILLNPMIGAAAMSLSSVSIILNALRLKNARLSS